MICIDVGLLFSSNYFITFLNAIITTVGAFIPIFIVLFIHYKTRRNFYLKLSTSYLNSLDSINNRHAKIQETLSAVYKKFTVVDQIELINKLQEGGLEIGENLLSVISELEASKMDIELDKMKTQNDLDYCRTYNFSKYLASILNNKYPDIYFKSK